MRLQVVNTAVRVAKRKVRQFHAHRVDGKVAPERRLLEAEFFIGMHHETAVAVTDLAFGTRERKVERKPLHRQVNHAERLAHQVRAAVLRKNRHQGILRHVVNFNVVVAAGLAEECVTHPSAHQKGTAARLADISRDFQQAPR